MRDNTVVIPVAVPGLPTLVNPPALNSDVMRCGDGDFAWKDSSFSLMQFGADWDGFGEDGPDASVTLPEANFAGTLEGDQTFVFGTLDVCKGTTVDMAFECAGPCELSLGGVFGADAADYGHGGDGFDTFQDQPLENLGDVSAEGDFPYVAFDVSGPTGTHSFELEEADALGALCGRLDIIVYSPAPKSTSYCRLRSSVRGRGHG